LNEDLFKRDIETLSANGMKVTSFGESWVEGTVESTKSGVLCTTIPYDDGWTVKVDGAAVETFALGDSLLSFDMQPGSHTISIHFFPKGLVPGIAISVVSLIALLLLVHFVQLRDTGKGFILFLNKPFWNQSKKGDEG
ncbi:MAG: YfhO family protein, partial [Clostridia bacterium]|nr:YfhO family protein [Clostridia bacterium]